LVSYHNTPRHQNSEDLGFNQFSSKATYHTNNLYKYKIQFTLRSTFQGKIIYDSKYICSAIRLLKADLCISRSMI